MSYQAIICLMAHQSAYTSDFIEKGEYIGMTHAEAYRHCIELQRQAKSSEAKEALGIAAQCVEMCDILFPAWQSPKKALPEKGEKVIAVVKSNSGGNIIDTAFYEKECWVFHNWETSQEDVIAWMKLPKFDEHYIK